MAKLRLLTKSRFKVGAECPTKLHYLDDRTYGNKKADDPFLRALAEGGFQVGELAKFYHPGGIEVTEKDYEQSYASTQKLLSNDEVTIFEAAIRFRNLFARVDVFKKRKNSIQLIEVKAKSFDSNEENPFFTKKKTLRSEWEHYLLDIAFQTYVAKKAFPEAKVSSYLMLADKRATATVDGINQTFLIRRGESNRTEVTVRPGTSKDSLGAQLLCRVNVDEAVHHIFHEKYGDFSGWETYVESLERLVIANEKAAPNLSSDCKQCEFRIDPKKFPPGTKVGFIECWQKVGVNEHNYDRPMVFDIWNFRRSQSVIDSGRHFMEQVTEEDIGPKASENLGLSSSQRQWIQVQNSSKVQKPYFDAPGLSSEMRTWKFPLHFIDFETTMTALPFNKGRRPYEQVAFQFSHHVVDSSGRATHKTQFIHRARGTFPNFHFVRELKKALSNDGGTIFRYSHHENTVLCQIYDQLNAARADIPDADDLMDWIKTVTTSSGDRGEWAGDRSMVDMCELVKRYYYSSHMNGSNSIKKVLPAILKDSQFLADKYSKPIYGTEEGVPSLNYNAWVWLQRDDLGNVAEPYKLLPPIFSEEDLEKIEPMVNASEIADGGAAMMAYALMQFTEMSDAETKKIQDALLKYCELDTFAMVMIFEHWRHLVEKSTKKTSAA